MGQVNTILSPIEKSLWAVRAERGALLGHIRKLSRSLFVIEAEPGSVLSPAAPSDFPSQSAAMDAVVALTGGTCRMGRALPSSRL
jgi:hypothetical protein